MEPTTQNEQGQEAQEQGQDDILVLSDGRKATFIDPKGKHQVAAIRAAKDQSEIPMALAAQLVKIDGQGVPYEDFLEMPLADVMAIQSRMLGLVGKDLSRMISL